MDEPHIEQATLEDLPQLTDLLIDLFAQEGDFEPNRAKQMRGLRLILEQPNRGRIFVLLTNRVHPCAAPIAMAKIRGEFHRLGVEGS